MLKIYPSKINGNVKIPASKSIGHRALICAALANGESIISNIGYSKDILATIECLRLLGADIRVVGDVAYVKGASPFNIESKVIYCNESGSTLRFLIPLFTLNDNLQTFTGSGKLMERPQSVYEKLYKENNKYFEIKDGKLLVKGPLLSGKHILDGKISSQFFTGLLLALPLLKEDSVLIIENELESKSYVDITIDVMNSFGVEAKMDGNKIYIRGGQHYNSRPYMVEGDYSSAAFLKLASYVNGEINITGLKENSLQGDRVFFDFVKEIKKDEPIFDLKDCPDLGPATMVLACLSKKRVLIKSIQRLRYKESDRVECMIKELEKFGFVIETNEKEMKILPSKIMTNDGIVIDCHNDHRIAMSLSILATVYSEPVLFEGYECVSKSYPDFYKDLASIGVKMEIC